MNKADYDKILYPDDGVVYALICPLSNKVRYIGSTWGSPKTRLTQHRTTRSKGVHGRWISELKSRRASKKIKLEILESNINTRVLRKREKHWINHFSSMGFDLTNTRHNSIIIWTADLLMKFVEYVNSIPEANKNIHDIVIEFRKSILKKKNKI